MVYLANRDVTFDHRWAGLEAGGLARKLKMDSTVGFKNDRTSRGYYSKWHYTKLCLLCPLFSYFLIAYYPMQNRRMTIDLADAN